MSEVLGRKIIYVTTLGIAVVFIIPCAVAKNIGTLLVCRAIDGIAFSAPMTLVGGSLADLWKTEERGVPMAAFSAAPFLGPAIGPLVGGFVSDQLGWRWLYWVMLIVSGAIYILMVLTVPETYAPTLLQRRAAKLRKETGDPTYVTETELDRRPFMERMQLFLIRPFQLLFRELIVFLISIYMSVLYGLLYMYVRLFSCRGVCNNCFSQVLRCVSDCIPRRQRILRIKDGIDVHPSRRWRHTLRRLRSSREQALPAPERQVQRQAPSGDPLNPHDVQLLAHPYRPLHFRVDIL